jgi:hypothetical protein
MADSFTVFVGYADSLRPSGFFPSPWLTTAGVVSNSSAAQTFDAGALRIDNTGATSITLTDVVVTLNPTTLPMALSPWGPGPLVVPAGGIAIFTQTVAFNFDTSDSGFLGSAAIGIDAAHPLGGCTNPGALTAAQAALCISDAPVVTFTENGNPQSFKDSTNIINTFGYDFIHGSSDGNESINWNVIGTGPSRGGTVPEPSSVFLFGSGLLVSLRLLRRRMRQQQ